MSTSIGAKLYFRGFKSGSSFADSSLKSLTELETVLIEEATEVHEEEFTKLDFSLRDKDADVKIALAYNPSSIHHWLYNFEQRESVTKIHTTFLDNKDNLGASFLEESEAMKKRDFKMWQNIFMGEWIDSEVKALFTAEDIQKANRQNISNPVYTVISIDPAVSVNASSDETGICAASKMEDGTYHIHRCIAEKWTPGEWAEKAVELFDEYDADEIVYESNQGGLLVEENLRNLRSSLPISSVRATKGKVLRAEPIVTLYEQEKVTHEPGCEALEQEMLTFTGAKGEKSPNLLDAMVWALTSLKNHKEFALQWG